MKTLKDISQILRGHQKQHSVKLRAIVETTKLSAVTIRGLLTGSTDSRLTTLLAVADELDLEVMLIPKSISAAMQQQDAVSKPHVPTLISSALMRKKSGDVQ